MPLEPTLKPGDTAPDFILKDQDGKDIALSSMRGKKVLLVPPSRVHGGL